MPTGLRGVGKTVLLNRFSEIAEQEGFPVAFVEAPETGEFVPLLAAPIRKVLLEKVKEGAGGDCWWVACGACDIAWQVPHYAESVG
jgi:long-subunit acyl-CoA synthetase (AMP-forming)